MPFKNEEGDFLGTKYSDKWFPELKVREQQNPSQRAEGHAMEHYSGEF